MWRTSTQNKGRYGIPGDGPSGPFFTPEACPDESRTDKRCARRVPPLSGRIWCGGAKAALGFAPPPPGARLRWPGTPAPGQHQPHLIFGGQAWPPLARPPPAGVGSDAISSTRCAHWPSQHVSAPAAGGLPLPGIQCPPCPPGGGGRRLDNGKEGSVRETQEGGPSPLKSIDSEAFLKIQKLQQKYFFDTLMFPCKGGKNLL